jgi:hypothetical protein
MRQGRVAPQIIPGDRGAELAATSAGELFSLCQTATSDGALAADQVAALRSWLERADSHDVPSPRYARALATEILQAARVAPVDLQALWRALEPALPEELRRRPAALRLVEHDGQESESAGGIGRTPNAVLAGACFMLADTHQARHASAVERYARAGEAVLLVRPARRAPDSHAIQVCASNGKILGQVPEHHARQLAPLLDRAARYRAHLLQVAHGEQTSVVVVQVFLYGPHAQLGLQAGSERRLSRRRESLFGWPLVRLLVALAIAAATAFVLRT